MQMFIENKNFKKFSILLIILFFLVAPIIVSAHSEHQDSKLNETVVVGHQASIYFNEACGGCTTYLHEVLEPTLIKEGVEDIAWKDYVNEKQNRVEYNNLSDEWSVPFDLRSHIMTFVDEKLILAGHIPPEYITQLLNPENQEKFDKLIIFQDIMHGEAENYKIWAFAGPVKEYSIDTDVTEYINWFDNNKNTFKESTFDLTADWSFNKLFPLILVSGFFDGINPCAFAVLLFFISFLFTIRKTKARIFITGLVYIGAIYLAYFFIGLGLFQAIVISGAPHLMAKIGAGLVILLGLINLIGHFYPRFPIKLKIPQFSKDTLEKWMHKSTLPAAFILGILVGLCTFPCSGGIYVAVISLLAAKATYLKGLGYMSIYNIMFIIPLLIILFGASNKYVTEKMTTWEQSKSGSMRLWSGILMILLGLIIFIFFV
ncbi:MAG: cytochrome c biogenesis CcdA family protein [bacterium]|nr:cytochrome c biogenesis CcdA family protein [bacterium]